MDCRLITLVILAVLPLYCSADRCLSPEVTSHVYTTTESTVSTDTVIIVEFSVICKNALKDLNLYAEFNGKTLPASKVMGANKYQVSWSDEHKKIPAGHYPIRFFDEEGYTDLRKAQRSGDDISTVKSLFTVDANHTGASKGQWVQSEFVAASVAILVWYLAYAAKSRLQI